MSLTDGLVLQQVRISLGQNELIPTTSLHIAPGEIMTVMGPSGTGKSTFLNFLCGTLPPAFSASGSITLNGRDITPLPVEKRRIGILFQDDLLFPHMSVGENLLFALPRTLSSRRQRRGIVDKTLFEAGLPDYFNRSPQTLSGGQRARVALMRTLLAKPQAVLLDEPFSKLDSELRANIRHFTFEHIASRGLPTLLVTHDISDAEAAAGPCLRLGKKTA